MFFPLPDEELLRHLEAVQFEVTTRCNLACAMCPRVNAPAVRDRPGRDMPFDLFARCVDALAEAGVHLTAVYPFWLGEPTMHPDFGRMFEYLMSKNFANALFECLEFDTNGHFLGEGLARHLLAYRRMQALSPATFRRLYVSIDAASAAAYGRIRAGGDFDRVTRNVERFLELRAAAGTEGYPRLALQMVVQRENAAEVAEFSRRFARLFASRGLPLEHLYALNKDSFAALDAAPDTVFLRPLYTSEADQPAADRLFAVTLAAATAELARDGIALRRVTSDEEDARHAGVADRRPRHVTGPCRYLMTRPLVTVDGLVLPCFNDDGCEAPLGSLADRPFLEVWNGERANALRRAQAAGEPGARCNGRCNGYVPFEEPAPAPPPGFRLYV